MDSKSQNHPPGSTLPTARSEKHVPPPDLDIRVTCTLAGNEATLEFILNSPAGTLDFHYQPVGKVRVRKPEEYHEWLMDQLDELYAAEEDRNQELDDLGRALYEELFPPGMRAAYDIIREQARTIQIVSDEPWIPWELVKPFNHEEQREPYDDDFLGVRFQLTRWLAAAKFSPAEIDVERLVIVAPDVELGGGVQEAGVLRGLAERQDVALREVETRQQLEQELERVEGGLWHFVGDGESVDDAGFWMDDAVFRPRGLLRFRPQLRDARPLVIMNFCWAGQLRRSPTRLGGWAESWVVGCSCGAFFGPQWVVRDTSAVTFAETFFREAQQRTLGEAALEARRQVRKKSPSSPDWLAYSVYCHPNGRLRFNGTRREPPPPEPSAVDHALRKQVAWEIFVELRTRVTVVPLEEGLFREALDSLYDVFIRVRRRLADAGPGVGVSPDSPGGLAFRLLNEELRPFLSRWHPRLAAWESHRPEGIGALEHEATWPEASQLRLELGERQEGIKRYAETLHKLADR